MYRCLLGLIIFLSKDFFVLWKNVWITWTSSIPHHEGGDVNSIWPPWHSKLSIKINLINQFNKETSQTPMYLLIRDLKVLSIKSFTHLIREECIVIAIRMSHHIIRGKKNLESSFELWMHPYSRINYCPHPALDRREKFRINKN